MRTIAIINQKGGCGKTTTAINLAGLLARAGRRTLLVDMDPQSHCAAGLGIPEHRLDMDIGDAMLAVVDRPVDPARLLWKAGRNLDLAPSRMRLAGLEAPRGGISQAPDRERRLLQVLDGFRAEYDVAIVDCSPAIGLLTFNALVAADMVIIPVETSFFSLQGATKQVNTIKTLTKRLNRPVGVWLLPTIHEEENAVASDLLLELKRRFKERLVPVVVRRDARLREAASFGQTIIDYDPRSQGAEDYTALATWTLDTISTMPELGSLSEYGEEFGAGFAPAGAGLEGEGPDPALIEVLPQQATDVVPRRAGEPLTVQAPDPAFGSATDEQLGTTRDAAAPAFAQSASLSGGGTAEIKSVSRAEDVARRAQQFLRRMATGQGASPAAAAFAAQAMGGSGVAEPTSPESTIDAGFGRGFDGSGGGFGSGELARGSGIGSGVGASATAIAPPLPSVAPAHPTLRMIEDAKLAPATIPAATQGLLGARATRQGVLFVQPLSVGKKLCIAGDFNGWSSGGTPMKKNEALGVFELCLRLEPGRYRYRVVVDGIWCADQYNEVAEMNPFGELNSIIAVPATP